MASLVLYWSVMIACYLLASRLRRYADRLGFVNTLLSVSVYALVFVMGLRMGANREVTDNLGVIGVQALLVTALTMAFSMLGAFAVRPRPAHRPQCPAPRRGENGGGAVRCRTRGRLRLQSLAHHLRDGRGGNAARLFRRSARHRPGRLSGRVRQLARRRTVPAARLRRLRHGAGGQAQSHAARRGTRHRSRAAGDGRRLAARGRGLLVPLPHDAAEGLAISAGFGWYTLAPSVISGAGHAVAGAVSFLHNVLRETLGIILLPLAASKIGCIEAVTLPGTCAMDVCLPIVERSCSAETLPYSFTTGMAACLFSALLVPLIMGV